MFYFLYTVSYLLITVFLSSKRKIRSQKGRTALSNTKVCSDLVLGRSMCPCSQGLSLQLCSTQMAPVCSVGLITTLASSEIAWIQNLIHVSSVIMALISEVRVHVPEDTFFLSPHVCYFTSGNQIKCKDHNASLWYNRGICNNCLWVYGCRFAYN